MDSRIYLEALISTIEEAYSRAGRHHPARLVPGEMSAQPRELLYAAPEGCPAVTITVSGRNATLFNDNGAVVRLEF